MDVLVNAVFNDYANHSSIINTTVAGITFSTSTRLGSRCASPYLARAANR